MGAIVVNGVLLAVLFVWLVASARGRRTARRASPFQTEPRPTYVPRRWPRYGIYNWIADRPSRMFGWLVFVPAVGIVAGVVVLLATHSTFGAVLIIASLVGVARTYGSARRALRAARSTAQDDR